MSPESLKLHWARLMALTSTAIPKDSEGLWWASDLLYDDMPMLRLFFE